MAQSFTFAKIKGDWGRLNQLLSRVAKQDDRGLALLNCAYIEEALGDVLRSYFRDGKAAEDLIGGFNAPLGTFAARSKAAFALGLLSAGQLATLDTLRKIRNEFAHNWEVATFEGEQIKALAEKLDVSRCGDVPAAGMTLHVRVSSAATLMLLELEYLKEQVAQDRLPQRHQLLQITPNGRIALGKV